MPRCGARSADVWEVNLPPLAPRVAQAASALAEHCRRIGRDAREIQRSMVDLRTRRRGA